MKNYIEKITDYIKSKGEDNSIFDWLTMNSDLVQSYLGDIGILKTYQPDSSPFIFPNSPLISSLLPDLRVALLNRSSRAKDHYDSIRQALVRKIGILLAQKEDLVKKRNNPIFWLIEGIRIVISIPLYLLVFVGIISFEKVKSIQYSVCFQILTAIGTVAGLISSFITIIDKWEDIILFIKNFFSLK